MQLHVNVYKQSHVSNANAVTKKSSK